MLDHVSDVEDKVAKEEEEELIPVDERTTVSRLVVKCLENEGVKYVFGIPGEENIHFIDALTGSSIRFILAHHEQAASFMADMYGRVTGKAGVCSATLGPGAINLLLGTADAHTDSVPLVAISAQVGLNRQHKETHQFVDLVSMFKPVTKWAAEIKIPNAVPEMVRKAFKVAQTERPGSCYLGIPQDLEGMSISPNLQPLLRSQVYDSAPSPSQVSRAAKVLEAAKSPIVLAGHGAARDNAQDALIRFSEHLHIPVAVGIESNLSMALDELAKGVRSKEGLKTKNQKIVNLLRVELEEGAQDDSFPVKPQRIVSDTRLALGQSDIVLVDTGALKMWMARLYPTYKPNTCLISNGLSTMAFALPGAIAVKLAYPERKVLAAAGDGGFLMLGSELETAVREHVPIVVLIWEDQAYGLIKWKMDLELGHHSSVDFQNANFVKYAESFGAKGYRISHADELLPTLKSALEDDAVSVIACPVDYSENMELTEKLGRLTEVL